MKASRVIASALALVVLIGVFAVPTQAAAAQKGKPQQPPAKPQRAQMPKEIQAVMQEGLATQQGRQDIPFAFVKNLTLIARGGLFPIFIYKAKNGDLGYAPAVSGSGEMEANLAVFYEFYRHEVDGSKKPFFGGKSMSVLTTDGANYDAAKEDWYSFGTGLEPGRYTLAMVLATPDLKKLSVAYGDVTVPGPADFQSALLVTEPLLLRSMDQVEQDQRPSLHRGCIYYGGAKFTAYVLDPVIEGGVLDIIYYVLGAGVKDPAAARPLNELEVNYEVLGEDGKLVVTWTPQTYDTYGISQQLPLERTIQKVDEKGTVLSSEKKPLTAGSYTLVVKVNDKVSGLKGESRVAFKLR